MHGVLLMLKNNLVNNKKSYANLSDTCPAKSTLQSILTKTSDYSLNPSEPISIFIFNLISRRYGKL